jgi:hypothetical protein
VRSAVRSSGAKQGRATFSDVTSSGAVSELLSSSQQPTRHCCNMVQCVVSC